MFSSITRTTFRSPVIARAYASKPGSKGVFQAMREKVMGAAEVEEVDVAAKVDSVKQTAQGMAEGMRQAAGAQTESMAQTGGQVKDALMGAAATASSVAGRVLPDMEKQQPSQADVPPELKSDPYAGEKLDKELRAQGKDVGTTGNTAGYSGNLATANPLVSGTSGGGLDGGSAR